MFLYRTSLNVTASDEDGSNIDDREDVEDSESSQSTPASSQQVYSTPPIKGNIQPGLECLSALCHTHIMFREISEKSYIKEKFL